MRLYPRWFARLLNLLSHVEAAVVSRGGRMLIVETSSGDGFERARSFYGDGGFEEEARIRDYFGPGDAKVVFRKLVSGDA